MFKWWEDVQPEGPQKMLNFLTQVPPLTFDPVEAFDVSTCNIIANLYEGLLVSELHTAELQPAIARSWEVIEKGRIYHFHLRPNTRFSNGDPILIEDILFSFKRIARSQEIELHVTQVQPRTLRVELEEPMYNFLALLATPCFSIVSQRGSEKSGFERENLLSSGPFRLKKNMISSHPSLVVLEKNPYYWDADNVKLEGAVYIPIMDPDERLRIFRTRYSPSGERLFFFLNHGPVLKYEELKHDPELQPTPIFATVLLTLNEKTRPLHDVRVRKALSLAIDRQKIIDTLLPFSSTADALISPGIANYPQNRSFLYKDAEQAKALLAEAGFPEGAGFPPITLTIFDHDYMEMLAQSLIEDWKRVLKISVHCLRLEWGDYLKHVEAGHYDLLYETWHPGIEDPCTFLVPFSTGHPSNRAGYSNARFDDIIGRSLEDLDDSRRMAAYAQAETILMDDMVAIPLLFESHFCMIDAGVKNAHLNRVGLLYLKYVELEE